MENEKRCNCKTNYKLINDMLYLSRDLNNRILEAVMMIERGKFHEEDLSKLKESLDYHIDEDLRVATIYLKSGR